MLERLHTSLLIRVTRAVDRWNAFDRESKMLRDEKSKLVRDFPEVPGESQADVLRAIRDEYAAAHADYVTRVSSAAAAISLEQVGLLAYVVRTSNPARVLDTGSGFSSYVLRREVGDDASRHVAVDDHAGWLDKTKAYLVAKGLSSENVRLWSDFERDGAGERFDLVYHDMGNMTTRLFTLAHVASLVAPDGLLVLDDMHKAHYAMHVPQVLGRGWAHASMVGLTRDALGRYACVTRRQ